MPKCALLMIDFQNIFKDATSSWNCPNFENALTIATKFYDHIPNCQTIITGFYPPDITNPDCPQVWKDYFKQYPAVPTNKQNRCYDLAFPADSYGRIVWSPTFGKWNVIKPLLEQGVDTVYICGVSTDCCVLSTALAAVDDGMKVYIISNACASGNDTTHALALEIMGGYGPNVEIKSF